jgi:LmbE family N-acetylglucosaminyl deacetylase
MRAMNVVSIMAHADDEMRCLGTMLACAARGDSLAFVTVTDGSHGYVQDPSLPRAEVAAIRQAEMDAVAAAVGGTHACLGEEDEFLYDTPEVRLRLIEAIRATRAELIFTHFGEDYNLDHITVSSLVRHCAMQSCLPVLPTASAPLAAHPAVFLIDPHGPFAFAPSHYVDISAQQARKAEVLALHASQEEAMTRALGYGLGEMSARLSSFRGEQAGCAFAEAFVPMPARGAVKPFPVLP